MLLLIGPVIMAEYLFSRAPREASNNTSNVYLAFFKLGIPSLTPSDTGI